MNSLQKTALFAGIGYLVIFITGIYANFFVLEKLTVPGNAVATAQNIMDNSFRFRIGILSFLIMVGFDLLLAWTLYLLFKRVHENLSLLSGWLRLINAGIFAAALPHLLGILTLTGSAGYLNALPPDLLHAKILLLMDSFNNTWLVGLVFFGLHLMVLGYLILKAGFMPKFIGYLLLAASAGYLLDSFAHFLLADYTDYKDIFSAVVIIPGIIGELSLTYWLLFKNRTFTAESQENNAMP